MFAWFCLFMTQLTLFIDILFLIHHNRYARSFLLLERLRQQSPGRSVHRAVGPHGDRGGGAAGRVAGRGGALPR